MAIRVMKYTEDSGSFQHSIKNLLNEYRLSLEVTNRSNKTISWYLEILHSFFSFLEKSGYNISIIDIGKEEVRCYIKYLQERERWTNRPKNGKDKGKLSAHSVQGHIRAIKAFWSWLTREGYLTSNPLEKFTLPKVPQYVIKILSPEQIKILLLAIDKTTPIGLKYYCIILILVDTGMRISELINIKVSNIDIQHGFVKVFGKGQKQRVIPLSRITSKELLRYLGRFRQIDGFV